MKKAPIVLQLVLILFLAMTIPVAIITTYSGTQIMSYAENVIAKQALAELEANKRLTENTLDYASCDIVRLLITNIFDEIRDAKTFQQLTDDYPKVTYAKGIVRELKNLVWRYEDAESAYFYLTDSDYVVASDKGLVRLSEYESVDWLNEALAQCSGISGIWYPHQNEAQEYVLSFVIPLNRISSSTRGTVVMNFSENKLCKSLCATKAKEHLLFQTNGVVVSATDKDLILKDISREAYVQEILQNKNNAGYMFRTQAGQRYLFTWTRTKQNNWILVNTYPMSALMQSAQKILYKMVMLVAVVMLLGAIFTVMIAKLAVRPLRRLVKNISLSSTASTANAQQKNELLILDEEFQHIRQEEERLSRELKEREDNACTHTLQMLMHGEIVKRPDSDLLLQKFSLPCFLVAAVLIDGYACYSANTNKELRRYNRYRFTSGCAPLFADTVRAQWIHEQEGRLALVLNFAQDSPLKAKNGIETTMREIQKIAQSTFGNTVTIGISAVTGELGLLPECWTQAQDAAKNRIITGKGQLHFWKNNVSATKKYLYPMNSERHILNYLETKNLGGIMQELAQVREKVLSAGAISTENILLIYHQIVGVAIQYLNGNNVPVSHVLGGNVYNEVSRKETVDEIDEYMKYLFNEIFQFTEREEENTGYETQILKYLEEHFSEDIVFEEMAKKIGISYSYMRKVVREKTGKSLSDYLNERRINEAKTLLQQELSIAVIARQVGYQNVQSLNRFFHKYEGMSASDYRLSKVKIEI